MYTSLTCPLFMHALYIEIGSTVSMSADEDPSLGKMETEKLDALL